MTMTDFKHYTQAPLPFIGQKRQFLNLFKQQALSHIPGDGAGWTIVDVFGGSGLLAHTAKRCKPAARVIYNDYDDYASRLRQIADTNRLRRRLAAILEGHGRNSRLDAAAKADIIHTIQSFDGYTDRLCLCSWLLFSCQQAADLDTLSGRHFYNNIRLSDYPDAHGYLDGLEITCLPFDRLLPQYADSPNTLLILDPPYVSTEQGAYAKSGYFGMVQFLRLMDFVRPPCVIFGSTRSGLPAYLDYLREHHPDRWRHLDGLTRHRLAAHAAKGVGYEDNMMVKF